MALPFARRHVRRLQIRAPTDAIARRHALSFEDALRTASLPGADSARLILIRRLDLGRLSPDTTPLAMALALEEAVRALVNSAVRGDTPAAATASAVIFADRIEALLALSSRLNRNVPAAEWYWAPAIPGWRPHFSRAEAWLHLLQLATDSPSPVSACARLTALALDSDAGTEFAKTLPRRYCEEWLRAVRAWPLPSCPPLSDSSTGPNDEGVLTSSVVAILRWAAQAWGPTDPRSVWCAVADHVSRRSAKALDSLFVARTVLKLEAFAESPGRIESHGLRAPANRSVESEKGRESAPIPEGDFDSPLSNRVPARDEIEPHQPRVSSPSTQPGGPPTLPGPAPHDPRSNDRPARADSISPHVDPDLRTAFGGLLFVIQILRRLGFESGRRPSAAPPAPGPSTATSGVDDDSAERARREVARGRSGWSPPGLESEAALPGFARRLLSDLAMRCLPALAAVRPDSGNAVLSGSADLDPLVAEFRPVEIVENSGDALKAWRREIRRLCRVNFRIGVANLIVRPARYRATPSHLDVFFDLNQADLRIRRAGLDIDPGWVPWLGRVIQFHYVALHDC